VALQDGLLAAKLHHFVQEVAHDIGLATHEEIDGCRDKIANEDLFVVIGNRVRVGRGRGAYRFAAIIDDGLFEDLSCAIDGHGGVFMADDPAGPGWSLFCIFHRYLLTSGACATFLGELDDESAWLPGNSHQKCCWQK
jgi:hypothetical protein